jgi:hypothetical protein
MRWVAAIGGGAFVLASLVVGLRLLRLAVRTRALPETALGIGLAGMGGFAYPLTSVARQAEALSDGTRTGLMVAAHALMVVGVTAVAVFTWRVFRPGSRIAAAATGAIGLALAACFVAQGVDPGYRAGALAREGAAIVWINALTGVVMAWAAAESLSFAALLRRREPLGLARPATTARVRHWGVAAGAATAITASALAHHALGRDPAASATGALAIGPLGLVAAVSLARAFAGPREARDAVAAAGNG